MNFDLMLIFSPNIDKLRSNIVRHLMQELSQAMQLRLQLLVVFLQDVHAGLQAALVLPQQLGLGQQVGLVGLVRLPLLHPAAAIPPLAVLLLQLLVLPLQGPGEGAQTGKKMTSECCILIYAA